MIKSDRKLLFISLTFFSFIFLSPFFAFAEDENIFYIKPSYSYSSMDLPDYAPIALQNLDRSFVERLTSHKVHDNSAMNEIVAGVNLKKDLFFEVKGTGSSYSSNESQLFDYSSDYRVGWYPIDGNIPCYVGFGHGDDVVTNTTSNVDYYELNFTAGKFFVLNEKYTMSTFAGYSYGKLKQSFETEAFEYQDSDNWMNLEEDISGTYNGLILGSSVNFSYNKFKTYLKVTFTGYYIDARYKGRQLDSPSLSSDEIYHTDEKSKFKGRLAVESGISREIFDSWDVELFSGLYVSSSPYIVASNESAPHLIDGSPTHIGFSTSTLWRIGLSLKSSF